MKFPTNEIRFLIRVGAVVAVVVAAKLVVHYLNLEVISLNALFTGIIAANVFLMGFLLSGVLSDYKESERLPGELSACLENMAQEVVGIGISKPEANVKACLTRISQLANDVHGYFYKKVEIADLLEGVNDLTVQFEGLQSSTQGTFIARLKQEQSNLRRTLIRINIIRETSFVSTGYLLADMITGLLCVGLVLTSVDPFYESMFFAGVISYLMIFLLMLIRDLDNPFGYYEGASSADVTLDPLNDTLSRLASLASETAGPHAAAKAGSAPVAAPAAKVPVPTPTPTVVAAAVSTPVTAEPKSKKKKGKGKRG
jgi:predicted membrane chloride channel (bestrophin family)